MAANWKVIGHPCEAREQNGPLATDIGGMRLWIFRSGAAWAVTCDGLKIRNRTLDTKDKELAKENALVVISSVASQFVAKYGAVRDAAEVELKNLVAKPA